GKPRVLELYLNIAEWGDGIFGAEAAARRWFGCSAEALRPVQAARLAAALPNPFKRNPSVHSRALTRKAARIVRGMHRAGLIDDASYEAAERELGLLPAAPEAAPTLPEPESAPADIDATEPEEPRSADADRTVRSICPYCGVGCGQLVSVENERITNIEGDPDSPISEGCLCP